jgi:4-amino-4-deoxy-L-arabinose transferase-like glycosyltransferase
LRVVVFVYLRPLNNDRHLEVILFLDRAGFLPRAGMAAQAYHPPLYYLLATPIWKWTQSPKAVQGLSLAFSLATLWTLGRLLRRSSVVPKRARLWCLALVAFHPPFVMNGLFISNDSLTILLGALLALVMARVASARRPFDRLLVGMILGLGLMTKYTFLAFVPPALLFLALTDRRRAPLGRRVLEAAAIGLLAIGLGCWKYVVNWLDYGNPFVSNLDFGFYWIRDQRPTVLGWKSFVDFNLVKLTLHPLFDSANRHSIPLLLYASSWHAFTVDSSFVANATRARYLGSLTYWAALAPTAMMLAGAWRVATGAIRAARSRSLSARRRDASLARAAILGCLALNCALVLAAGLHYDVWSVFQGRLLFPACAGWAMIFGWGLDATARRGARSERLACVNLWILHALFILYFAVEVSRAMGLWRVVP